MSTTTSSIVVLSRRDLVLARLAAYCELSKPRIAALVLVVVAVSALDGGGRAPEAATWIATLAGTALIAASASAMNQVLERRSDALMDRTADRPLPSGKISTGEAISFAAITGVAGIVCMAGLVNLPTAMMGALTWLLYVVVYTPSKRRTSANTAIGAVAGAMPVFIGWAAAAASFSLVGPAAGGIRVAALFLIVYLWQFPHFMAIAWLYREQYAAAGLKMLTVVEPTGARAGAQAVLGALALMPISVLPLLAGQNPIALAGAISLAVAYLLASALFYWRRDETSARRLLQMSLVYLPGVLLMLVLSPVL
jgi:protoheme IX farnesyltransferase